MGRRTTEEGERNTTPLHGAADANLSPPLAEILAAANFFAARFPFPPEPLKLLALLGPANAA